MTGCTKANISFIFLCCSKHLIKFGQLKHRLWIRANEDVFEKTKSRMAAIELEQRKNW